MIPHFDDLVITRWGARFQGRNFPCAVGRGGIGKKLGEGDGITPHGCFEISHIRVRPDRLGFRSPSLKQHIIGPQDIWSDDPKDPNYNQAVTARNHPYSHEPLHRADPLYNAIGVLTYNWPNALPGKGSAIFLHIWRKPRHPTEGCVAFSAHDLVTFFTRWTLKSRVLIRS